MLDKLKSKIIEKSKIIIKDISLIDETHANARLEICLSCEHYNKIIGNCKLCGCFVKAKTKIKGSECPIKKW